MCVMVVVLIGIVGDGSGVKWVSGRAWVVITSRLAGWKNLEW